MCFVLQEGYPVFYHCTGVIVDSCQPQNILKRLAQFITFQMKNLATAAVPGMINN